MKRPGSTFPSLILAVPMIFACTGAANGGRQDGRPLGQGSSNGQSAPNDSGAALGMLGTIGTSGLCKGPIAL